MDRQIVYTGAIPQDLDVLLTNKNTMTALGMVLEMILGTGTWVSGLNCTPTGPASMQVVIAQGSIVTNANVDGTAYGSLGSDTAHQIVKQGITALGNTLFTLTAPVTTGQSVVYLIQGEYQDVDAGSVVLPYYNASNPAVAYNGPANSGTSQNTVRKGSCVLNLKTGTSATTGTQVAPTPDAGFTGLWLITVANGATTVVSGNIARYPGAPFILEKLNDKGTGSGTTRPALTGNATYYVNASTGNNSTGNGTIGTPWLTIQHAVNFIYGLDFNNFAVTVNCAGAFTAGAQLFGKCVGQANEANLVFSFASGATITQANDDCFLVHDGAQCTFQGTGTAAVISTTGSGGNGGHGIDSGFGAQVAIGSGINFGVCYGDHLHITQEAWIAANASYGISGNAVNHMSDGQGGNMGIAGGITVTLTGTPAFSGAFAAAAGAGAQINAAGVTYTGSATGVRFSVANGAVINTNGGGPTYFPGNSSGTGTDFGTSPYGLYL